MEEPAALESKPGDAPSDPETAPAQAAIPEGVPGVDGGQVAAADTPTGGAGPVALAGSPLRRTQQAPPPEELYSGFQGSEEASFEEIEFGPYISKGITGSVYRARYNGMQCAVKRFTPQGDDPEIVRSFRNEVFLMGKLNHANLVRFYAAVTEPARPCIITELMVGSLTDLLYGKDKKNLPDDKWHDRRKLGVVIGIVNGVKFLHSKKVCHRDLKSPNVLYDKDLNIKLCDFAFSTYSQQASMRFESRVGTPAWMAPEVLNGDVYTLSADIYSLAVIIWEIVTRSEPWAGTNPFAVAFKVVNENLRLETAGFDAFWKDLLQMCWAEPHERPTIGEVDQAMKFARADVLKGKTFASGAGTPVPKVMPRAAIQAFSKRTPQNQPGLRVESVQPEPEVTKPVESVPAQVEPEPQPETEPEPQPQPEPEAELKQTDPVLQPSGRSTDSPSRQSSLATPRTPTTPNSLMPEFRQSQVMDVRSVVQVAIPSTTTRGSGKNAYIDYTVQCTAADGRVWETQKRFSEFDALRKALCSLPDIDAIPFPKKPLLNFSSSTDDAATTKKRRRELEAWLIAVLRNRQDDGRLAKFFGTELSGDDSDGDDDELSQLDDKQAQLRCTTADVLCKSALHYGDLHKEGKVNRKFKSRFFVLWRDPAAHASEDTLDQTESTSARADVPMHLVYYADKSSLPKGVITLIPGSFTVGVPKRARRSLRHCLRIDGTYPIANDEGTGVTAFKYVLADDNAEVIRGWRVALTTGGGIEATEDEEDVEATDEEEYVCVDSIKVVGASTAQMRYEFRQTSMGENQRRVTMKSPTAGNMERSVSADSPQGRAPRGKKLRKAPSARIIGLEKMLQSPRRMPEAIDFTRNDDVEFIMKCTTKNASGVRTWEVERSFGDLVKLRDTLVASPGINIDAFDNRFPAKRWVPTNIDQDQLIEWCKEVEQWVVAALLYCRTNRALARFFDEAGEPATTA